MLPFQHINPIISGPRFSTSLIFLNGAVQAQFRRLEDGVRFAESVYSYWTNNQQGCIHAIHFYSGGTSDSGMVQDDYINPAFVSGLILAVRLLDCFWSPVVGRYIAIIKRYLHRKCRCS